VAGVLVAAGRHHAKPDATAAAYLAAWTKQDFPAMQALVAHPPSDFVAIHQRVVKELHLTGADYRLQAVHSHGAAADAGYLAHLDVGGLGRWDLPGTIHLQRSNNHWQVEWTPAAIHPALPAGGHFVTDRTWPARAGVLGAGGAALTGQNSVVSIGLQGSRVKDAGQVTAALTQAGADPAKVAAALTAAKARPDQFVAVFSVPEDRYQQVRPALFPIPGVVFQRSAARGALTPDLSAHVVGSVAPVTAEQLKKLGPPYESGDVVGQTGIEGSYERQLAGTPGGTVRIVDGQSRPVATVMNVDSRPGTAVVTTIDPLVERAAERALDGVAQPAALVAIRASTGEVLAAVSRPTTQFDRALGGHYPPGSTFKVITAAALLAGGLTPDSPASCPPTVTVGGRSFHNFEGETQPSLPLHRAFAISCNTAFVGLAGQLSPQALVTTAGQFGFGADPQVGLPVFGGRVPAPNDDVEKAATAIGQARVEASPLMMATVAAAVDSGALHQPRLVAGAPDDTSPSQPLLAGVASGLRTMMAEVVASGTGTAAAVPGGLPVYGKTGTAEFGTANPPTTHAWFIGYRGDVAFAVLVEGGGVGGQVAAPLAAKFLRGL
jgi:cell division protein FtsI/penicillin-binding protein 2